MEPHRHSVLQAGQGSTGFALISLVSHFFADKIDNVSGRPVFTARTVLNYSRLSSADERFAGKPAPPAVNRALPAH
jgi:hypothetical protein